MTQLSNRQIRSLIKAVGHTRTILVEGVDIYGKTGVDSS